MRKNFLSIKIKSIVIIAPEKSLLKKIKDSFLLIKKIDAKEYNNIFNNLNSIFITNKNGYTNEFFMPEKIWFVNKSLIKNSDLNWLASLIIHESFHATQFKNGKYILPLEKLEKPATKIQQKFLYKLKDYSAVKDVKTALKKEYWEKMNEDKKSFVYFRNLLNFLENKKIVLKKIK